MIDRYFRDLQGARHLPCASREWSAITQITTGREPSLARTQGASIPGRIGATEDQVQGQRPCTDRERSAITQIADGGDGSHPWPPRPPLTQTDRSGQARERYRSIISAGRDGRILPR